MSVVARSLPVLALLALLTGCQDSTAPIAVASVRIEPTSAALSVGKNLQLTATALDADRNVLTDRALAWSSSNAAVVVVSSTGLLLALAPGQVVITATADGQSASALITSQLPVVYVSIGAPKSVIAVGESILLAAIVADIDHRALSGRKVTFSTSNGSVATVSASGLVTGVTPGSVLIEAECEGRIALLQIIVFGPVASVSVAPQAPMIPIGAVQLLSVTVRDANGATIPGRIATWASGSGSVATVSSDGLVTALSAGQAMITATVDGKSGTTTVTVPPPVTFAIAALGMLHTCALDSGSRAYCWGNNDDGQLGNGTLINRAVLSAVAGGLSFSTVSGGARHTCGLDINGLAYCWGTGAEGQLGAGGTRFSMVPVRVSSALTFIAIAAGESHTCALTAAGVAHCWGRNDMGQLGNGTTANRSEPSPVTGSVSFASISAGGGHTCGLTAAGSAYCWGANDQGQLGSGSTVGSSAPIPVTGGGTFASLSLGASHTCGVAIAGTASCWGANFYGQLGDGSTAFRTGPVVVSGGRAFATVSAGTFHTCGVATDGRAFCWGSNETGQLGDGGTSASTVPVAVTGGLAFRSISATSGRLAGDYYYYYYQTAHTCGVTTNRVAYCWGSNAFGQLGNTSAGSGSSMPVKVAGQQ